MSNDDNDGGGGGGGGGGGYAYMLVKGSCLRQVSQFLKTIIFFWG